MKIKNKILSFLSLSLLGFSVLFGVSALLNHSSDNDFEPRAANKIDYTLVSENENIIHDFREIEDDADPIVVQGDDGLGTMTFDPYTDTLTLDNFIYSVEVNYSYSGGENAALIGLPAGTIIEYIGNNEITYLPRTSDVDSAYYNFTAIKVFGTDFEVNCGCGAYGYHDEGNCGTFTINLDINNSKVAHYIGIEICTTTDGDENVEFEGGNVNINITNKKYANEEFDKYTIISYGIKLNSNNDEVYYVFFEDMNLSINIDGGTSYEDFVNDEFVYTSYIAGRCIYGETADIYCGEATLNLNVNKATAKHLYVSNCIYAQNLEVNSLSVINAYSYCGDVIFVVDTLTMYNENSWYQYAQLFLRHNTSGCHGCFNSDDSHYLLYASDVDAKDGTRLVEEKTPTTDGNWSTSSFSSKLTASNTKNTYFFVYGEYKTSLTYDLQKDKITGENIYEPIVREGLTYNAKQTVVDYDDLYYYLPEHHTFIGWSLNPDGSGYLYQEGDEILVKLPLTLYAVYETPEFEVISEVNIDIKEEALQNYVNRGSLLEWFGKEAELIELSEEDKERFVLYSDLVDLVVVEPDGYEYTTDFREEFTPGYSYKIRFELWLNSTEEIIRAFDGENVTSSNEKISISYDRYYDNDFIYVTYDLGDLPKAYIDSTDFEVASEISSLLVTQKSITSIKNASNSLFDFAETSNFRWHSSDILVDDGNGNKISATGKLQANQTYYLETVYRTGTITQDELFYGFEFDKNITNETEGFELEVDETGEILTVRYAFVPMSNEIEVLNVTINTEPLVAPYPDAILYDRNRGLITTSDYPGQVALNDTGYGDQIALTYGDEPLSEWDWSTNPVTSNNISTNFMLTEGVYAGYFATFVTSSYYDYWLRFTENTVVKAVDQNGNTLDNVYYAFRESGDSKYIIVVYDLGQCKRAEVDEVEITVYNEEAINKFTSLYPGDNLYDLDYSSSELEAAMSISGASVGEEDIIGYSYFYVEGVRTTSDDPSTITSILSWNQLSNTYFYEGQRIGILYQFYLSDVHDANKKYDFVEGMKVNLVDRDGNAIEGAYTSTLPYYYNGQRYANQFYLVIYFDTVEYAGEVNELSFETAEGIEWPTSLKPEVVLKDAFPSIAEMYANGSYNIITSSTSEVTAIYQTPGSNDFDYNSVYPDMGLGVSQSTDSYGYTVYSIYDESDFTSEYSKLVEGEEYAYGFIIKLKPGYRLSANVQLPNSNYKIVYSLVDELNRRYSSAGYSQYGSSQLYWIVYTIGTPEYDKVTQLGISFNEELLSNVTLESGAYLNKVGSTQIPNYEFVTYGNKVGYITSEEAFLNYIEEEFNGDIDAYWEDTNAYYLEYYGIEYPEELKYISNGYWMEESDSYGWSEPELIRRDPVADGYENIYEFALRAGVNYGFGFNISTEPGYVFDLESISIELNNAGFEVIYSTQNRIEFIYELGKAKEKVVDYIEFDYFEEFEIDEEDIVTGGLIPYFYDYYEGIILPTDEYSSMIDYFEIVVLYGENSSYENGYDMGWLYPGDRFAYNKYHYMVVCIELEEGYVFSPSLTHNLIEKGYEVYFYDYDGETDYHYVTIAKKIGYATGESISSGELVVDKAFKTSINQPVANVTSELLSILPSDKIEIVPDSYGMYFKAPNKSYWSSCGKNDTFIQGYTYSYRLYLYSKEGYAFTSDFELSNLPEGSNYYVYDDGVTIYVEYNLGVCDYTYIDQIDVTVTQDFIDSYLAFEQITYTTLFEAFVINEQNANYVVAFADLYYLDEDGNPEYVDLSEPLSPMYTYYIAGYIGTGVNNEEIGQLGDYRYSPTVTNKTSGYIVKIANYDDEDKINLVEVSYQLPALAFEQFEEVEITLGESLTYNGSLQTQEITVKHGDLLLEENVHYFVINNKNTDAKTYTMTVVGIGLYKGEKTVQYTIEKATHVIDVTFEDLTVTYDGEEYEILLDGNLPAGVTVEYSTNKATNAGTYEAKAKFIYDTANYNAIADMTATLTINKATHDMSGVTFENLTVTYDGNEHEVVLDGTLPSGVTATVTSNKGTNAGTYNAVAKFEYDTVNYNAIEDKTATLVIIKATHDMSGVTFENVTVIYDGSEHEVVLDGILPVGVTVSYSTNKGTNAGTYNAVATFTYDTVNYNAIADKTAKLTINKATHDMSGISFKDVAFAYDGKEHVVEISGTLPTGVTVSYTSNKGTNVGTYNAVAKFTYDTINYNAIPDMTATLKIKEVAMSFDTNSENEHEEDVIVTSKDGIDPDSTLEVKLVAMEQTDKDFTEFLKRGQAVAVAYDVKLLKDEVSVQPDGILIIRILIPRELLNRDFGIMHVHDGSETEMLNYTIDGDYVEFETNKLSEFVFVYETGSILWVVIALGVIALLEGAVLVYLLSKKKQLKASKLAAAYPPYIFGMFIPAWQIIVAIILVVAVVALAVIDVLVALSLIKEKEKNEEPKKDEMVEPAQVEENDDNEDDVIKVWNEETHSYTVIRIIKSFTARLCQSSDEVKNYYDNIKNELLSYQKVKSKISFKHETFKIGKENVARLRYRGKTLCLYLSLNPKYYLDSKYKIEDMSEVSSSVDVPTMYRINLPRRVVYARELIAELMSKYGAVKVESGFVNYSSDYAYENNESLLEKGLIKKLVKVVVEDSSSMTVINPINESSKEPQL